MSIPVHTAEHVYKDSLIRAAVLRHIDKAIESLGLDADEILSTIDYDFSIFSEEESRLSITELATILEHCANKVECEIFGIVLAEQQSMEVLGSVGLLMQTASSIKQAFIELIQVLHVHASPVFWSMSEGKKNITFEFNYQEDNFTPIQSMMISQLSFGQTLKVFNGLSNDQIYFEAVYFRQAPPLDRNKEKLRQFFKCPVYYQAESDCIIIDKRLLQPRTLFCNEALHEIIKEKIYQSVAYRSDISLMQKVKMAIKSQLGKQQCSLASIASHFGCDKRTLQRHLKEEYNSSFRHLLDEVIKEMADYYLTQTNFPISQIAYALGYAEPANFTRAFRKLFACTPVVWRQKKKMM